MLRKMKILLNVGKKYPVKLISNDAVDKDVQSMLLPLNLMHNIIFCPKYRIKDNVITPNSFITNFFAMIATLVYIFTFVHCTYLVTVNKEIHTRSTFMYYIPFYNCFFYSFGLSMNFVNGVIRTKSNIQFVLMFQKVHRFINNESGFKHIIIWSWIIFLEVLSIYTIVFTYFQIQIGTLFSVYAIYFLIIFDFNVIYFMRVMRLLENELDLWNIQHLNLHEREDKYEINYCTTMFQAYVDILKCYNSHKDSFQQFVSICYSCFYKIYLKQTCSLSFVPFQILYYITKSFVYTLVNIKLIIDTCQIGMIIDKTVSINFYL